MKEHKNFTIKSFLRRFIISQLFLSAFLFCILAVSNRRPRQQVKLDTEKVASKIILSQTTAHAVKK